jgi:hypothetical protein
MVKLGGFWKAGAFSAKPDAGSALRIKGWTRAALSLGEDATVSVNEIICADPACPGSETVILVMVPGLRTKAYKVQAAMAEVSEEMVGVALNSL